MGRRTDDKPISAWKGSWAETMTRPQTPPRARPRLVVGEFAIPLCDLARVTRFAPSVSATTHTTHDDLRDAPGIAQRASLTGGTRISDT